MKPDEKKAVESVKNVTGLGVDCFRIIISVIGTDMDRLPTDAHPASWAGMCPGDHESAKKRKSGKNQKGNRLLRTTLITCAHSAVNNKKSFFHAQYKRISARRGGKRAYVAVAHSMLTAVYHKERKINSLIKKLKTLVWDPSEAMAGQTT